MLDPPIKVNTPPCCCSRFAPTTFLCLHNETREDEGGIEYPRARPGEVRCDGPRSSGSCGGDGRPRRARGFGGRKDGPGARDGSTIAVGCSVGAPPPCVCVWGGGVFLVCFPGLGEGTRQLSHPFLNELVLAPKRSQVLCCPVRFRWVIGDDVLLGLQGVEARASKRGLLAV